MFKRTAVIAGTCLVLLAGCGEAEKTGPTSAVPQQEQDEQHQVSKTAIYLPGGAGLDFGREPSRDVVIEDAVSKVKIVTYEFKDDYEAIDKSISDILVSDGYSRVELPPGDDKKAVHYQRKGETPVIVRYREEIKEGFYKRTSAHIYWRL